MQLTAIDAVNGSSQSGWLCTYGMNDNLGNLRCVVLPEGIRLLEANGWNLTNTAGLNILKEQCFQYEYNGRSRMMIKQTPGGGTCIYGL